MKEQLFSNILPVVVEYNHNTGELIWKHRHYDEVKNFGFTSRGCKTFNTKFSGKVISNTANTGYIQIGLYYDGNKYMFTGHRVAWFLYYGTWPTLVDHIDGDKLNNKITNLRDTSPTMNAYNSATRSDCSSGVTGVSYKIDRKMWKAYYFKDGIQHHLGYFKSKDSAISARKEWELSTGHIFRTN